MVTSDDLIDAAISCEVMSETVGASNTYGLGTVLRTLAVMARSMSHDSEISHLKDALRPLAELPVGTELFTDDDSLDTVLYKNGGKSITARDVMIARGHIEGY